MNVQYKVYKKVGDDTPIISLVEIPRYQLRGKKKFVGRKAKIEAIYRHSGVLLPANSSTEEVNQYIAKNLFKTPEWASYHIMFKQVRSEVETIADTFEFQYLLNVEFSGMVDPADLRTIYLVTAELMGKDIDQYQGVNNNIVSLKKEYINE